VGIIQKAGSIMKNQSLILLVVAVGCGLVAMLGVKQVISQKPSNAEEMVQVLSAASDILPGDRLDELNTKFVQIAVSSVPEGAVLTMEDVEQRSLKVPVTPGDWILKGKLTEKGQIGAEASIPTGMATVTIPVDSTTSHSGMLRPGNRIDLLLTFNDPSAGSNQQKTITVLEFVEVFAVDNRIYGIDKAGDAQAKNITLLVTPEQGKAVTLATKIGGGYLSTMMRARDQSTKHGKTEISQEFLTSSFLGSNREAPSVMDLRSSGKTEKVDPALEGFPEDVKTKEKPLSDKSLSVSQLLDQELDRNLVKDPGGSGPVIQLADAGKNKNTWTMEIYQGETLRLESIELPEAKEKDSGNSQQPWSLLNLWNTK